MQKKLRNCDPDILDLDFFNGFVLRILIVSVLLRVFRLTGGLRYTVE